MYREDWGDCCTRWALYGASRDREAVNGGERCWCSYRQHLMPQQNSKRQVIAAVGHLLGPGADSRSEMNTRPTMDQGARGAEAPRKFLRMEESARWRGEEKELPHQRGSIIVPT